MSAYQKINVNEATVCSDVELRSHVGGLFVWNNPLKYTDPSGFMTSSCLGGYATNMMTQSCQRQMQMENDWGMNFTGGMPSGACSFDCAMYDAIGNGVGYNKDKDGKLVLEVTSLNNHHKPEDGYKDVKLHDTGDMNVITPTAEEVIHAELALGSYEEDFKGGETGYVLEGDPFISDSGFEARLYKNNDTGHSILVYVGTNGKGDWPTNFKQGVGLETAQYNEAISIANLAFNKTDGNITFVGHSLGGGLASTAAIWTGGTATVFNAAGVHPNTLGDFTYSRGTVTHFYSTVDPLQFINAVTRGKVPGRQVSLGFAGFHPMKGVCKVMECRE